MKSLFYLSPSPPESSSKPQSHLDFVFRCSVLDVRHSSLVQPTCSVATYETVRSKGNPDLHRIPCVEDQVRWFLFEKKKGRVNLRI